ncbi:MAG: chitobiase/beta-hexosaminidase C-terminal domain-containing protein, partial [Bacteroidales bacterium]|nr:chitobiase/beta-hexosaminidase C-terminal domain-containing protein [Bacteroidales bacterium]
MKRRFTILSAALALLVSLAIPMGVWGQTTYEQLTSIANIDESAQYVLGIDGTGFHYEGTSSWGKTALPSAQTPIYYTLTKATDGNSFTAHATISGTTYYLQIPTSNTFSMATSTGTNTDIIIGTTQVSGTNYAVANKTTTARHLRINGTSGLRSYAGTTGTMAFFYKVVTSSSNTYTVTFDAGDGTFVGNTDFPNTSNTKPAGTYNLPSATPATGYTFDGWTATGISTPITGSYTVSSNIEFTAQYTQNSGSGTVTATLTQSNLELTGSYSSNTSKTIDGITYVHTDLMKNNSNIQAKASTGTIKNTTAYPGDITSVAITHSGTARATTINGSADGTNWTQVATGSGSITADFSGRGYKYFQITRGSNAAYWEKIDITYSTTSSSLTDSDLAITNASTTLSFDLYNNSAAQTITYTTSSTGSITITPASPTEYFSYVHDATAKTITVTPTAVTPSAQTVTINQAADDDYYAGSASFTVSIANSDPNVPGTVNNPYTVAQARAAIDANTGITGVYATGIVSQVDSYNSNYHSITYWISDDGTTTNQLEAYGGISGITGWTFASKDDIEVGATVVIYGNLKKYNSTYEFDVNNELVSYMAPQHAVEAPTFSPAAGTFTTAQTVTLSCATTGATIYYTLDGTEPTSASTQYTAALTISSTTTVKAIAYVGTDASTVATATYHFCSAEDPYTVTEALAFNEYPANGIYVRGIVSTAPTSLSSGMLTYSISVDGEATNELEVYKGKGLNNEAFTAVDDIQVGDIVTIYGNVVIYYGTKEFTTGNYLVSFERPAREYTLTVTCSENVEIFTFVGESTDPGVEGSTTLQVTNGTEVGLSVSVPEGYILTLMVDGQNVTSQLDETGWYEFTMPTHDVTVIATASVAPVVTTNTYTLATSIESGKQYIIVGWANGTPYAMGYQKSNNRHAVEISVTGDGNENASATIANTETNAHEFTIISLGEGFYSIEDATNSSGYLYAASSSSNHLKTESTLSDNSRWEITVNSETGLASVVATNSSNRNVMQFNNSDKLFACYATASQHPVYLYVKDEPRTYTKSIAGWDVGEEENAFNFYLIASPIGDVDPTSVTITSEDPDVPTGVTNMVSSDFDLYYFDHNRDKEWVNYKQPVEGETSGFNPGFNVLETGKGYLYANKYDVTLVFTGTGITSGEQTIPLAYYEEGDGFTIDLPGWNLLGNPFAETAYLTTSNSGITTNFYTMDAYGVYLPVTNGSIEAMEGVFV